MKLKLVTEGNLRGASVYDAEGKCLGFVDEIVLEKGHPITVVKIGDETSRPTPADLDAWRQVFEQAQYDKDFKIFTHSGVTIETLYLDEDSEIKIVSADESGEVDAK